MSAPNPDCPICGGSGMAPAEVEPPHPPRFNRCECVLRLDILENVEKGLTGLTKAPPLKTSPLLGKESSNLWITQDATFLSHLRHVAIRQPTSWNFKVVSDAELVTAWLASIALKGQEILDADAYLVSTKYLTIPDLVVPPDLLVIRMGVKVARNQAAHEVLAEALQTRIHENKPTWVWDEPHHPLNAGHLFWSDAVGRVLRPFERMKGLGAPGVKSAPGKTSSTSTQQKGTAKRPTGRKTLRGG